MYLFYSKKDVVKKINSFLEDYNGMKELCSLGNNDIKEVCNSLGLIIDYILNNHISFMKNSNNIVDCYYDALYSKKEDLNKNNNILNGRLEEKDLKGIRIPSTNFINKICEENLMEKQEIEKKNEEKNKYYNELKGFNEVGFTFTRPEMIHLDKDFKYYYYGCTGDVNYDYHQLYKDERYSKKDFNNPLYFKYSDNLDSIKYSNNLQISKYGKLNCIDNGRHRIVYLLNHGWDVDIPCTVTRRIENREFNIITDILMKKYNAQIYKENLLDDQANIVISISNRLYKVHGVEQLKKFYYCFTNQRNVRDFYISSFENMGLMNTYLLYIYKKELIELLSKEGSLLLNMNFSDLLERYPKGNNQLFYEAFNQLKTNFLRSRVYASESDLSNTLLKEYRDIISALTKHNDRHNYGRR